MSPSPTNLQKLAVTLAFVAAGTSLAAAAMTYARRGEIASTPLFGGLFMLFMALSGFFRLRRM